MIRLARSSAALTFALALAVVGCSTSKTGTDAGPVLDVSLLDTTLNPCVDFNGFVNNKWVAANPIPPDRSRWGSFDALTEKSLEDQHTIVTEAASNADQAQAGSIEQKIGWLFRAGMDSAAIDAAGYDPIKPKLASIAALKTSADVVKWLNHSFSEGDQQVFFFGSNADFKNAKMQIASTFQGGLGLPTADYYSKAEYKDLRDKYRAHIAKLFELTGVSAPDAEKKAATVLDFETSLASHSLVPVQLRKPENQYHFVTVAEANKITPHFDWGAFFRAQGVDVGKGFSLPPGTDCNASIFGCKFDCIADEVRQDVDYFVAVKAGQGQIAVELYREIDLVLLSVRHHSMTGIINNIGDVIGFNIEGHFIGAELLEIEDLVDKSGEPFYIPFGNIEEVFLVLIDFPGDFVGDYDDRLLY